MNGKTKALGLALFAALALSAMGASAAQAGTIDVGVQPAVVTGANPAGQIGTLTVPLTSGGFAHLECTNVQIEGTTQGLQLHEGTVTPRVTGCTAFGANMTVDANGCKLTLTGSGQPANTALGDIVGCTAGKQIQVTTPICTIDFPMQNGLSHGVGEEPSPTTTPHTVTLTLTVGGITGTETGLFCPNGNNHHFTNGSLSGSGVVKAFVDNGNGQAVTHNGHQYFPFLEGAQASITST